MESYRLGRSQRPLSCYAAVGALTSMFGVSLVQSCVSRADRPPTAVGVTQLRGRSSSLPRFLLPVPRPEQVVNNIFVNRKNHHLFV